MPRSLHSRRLVAEALDILGGLPGATHPGMPRLVPPVRSAALTPEQAELAARVNCALEGWRAAVLAAPVGSGKTWIALHAASTRGGTIAVIGPAALRGQWLNTAARFATGISYTSLERVSLGHLPPPRATCVLIDEAHRLRNPGTRRVRHLTPWLVGRETLFITGTPIVNGPRDLIRLLRLCLADDCLRLDGVPSLDALVDQPRPPRALQRLVIRGPSPRSRVAIVRSEIEPPQAENARGDRVITTLSRLRLGESAAIGRLARVVLLDAAGSSDAAWHRALRRYRTLLRHAEQAGSLSRADIRAFVGPATDQGVMWELFRTSELPSLLPLDDLQVLDEALADPPDDSTWLPAVVARIDGLGPALLFTRHLGTLDSVRRALGFNVAWVSGASAGIGEHRLPRGAVLAAFGPSRETWRLRRTLPDLLVLSDVGSEGLDLQGAKCVVHLDLPWHDTGVRQRTGRAARIGQRAHQVVEIRRLPPIPIASALGIVRVVRRKGRRARGWIQALAGAADPPPATGRGEPGTFAMIVIVRLRSGARRGELALGRLRGASRWQPVDAAMVELCRRRGILIEMASQEHILPQVRAEIRRLTAPALVSRPELVTMLLAAAESAAQRRASDRLIAIDHLLRCATQSHGIGVERRLTSATVDQLLTSIGLFELESADQIEQCQALVPSRLKSG